MRVNPKNPNRLRYKIAATLVGVTGLIFLSSCIHIQKPGSGTFTAKVNTGIVPKQAISLDRGRPQAVAASRDGSGVQSEFVEGIVILKPKGPADLQAFLDRYAGTVVDDDTVPELPAESGRTLTAEQRKPIHYKIRIDLAKVNAGGVAASGMAAGLRGALEFSSDAGLRTFACVVDAKAAGFTAIGDHIAYGNQVFPLTVFKTEERPTVGPPAGFNDPFTNPAYQDFGSTGNQSNVFLAWQFIAAHGIQRRTRVAIIDNGFYLDGAGRARGTDSDFPPAPGRPLQYDIDFKDQFAGDPNPNPCSPQNPCWWHGTASAGVATGLANNHRGEMGTGGQVADPILLRVNGTAFQRNEAIRRALDLGADVVSMSFSGDCNVWCRMDDRDINPYNNAVASGSKVVFVAAAGNGQGNPPAGYDVGAPSFVHPCTEDNVICVGALQPGGNTRTPYTNFGSQVQIFAPTNIPVMSVPPSVDGAGNPLPLSQADGTPVALPFGGTSASTPFVAGVVAMMKAVNPGLNHQDIARILRETARPGAASQVTRTLDAYAAVRRAAGVTAVVTDALENNDLETVPTNLGTVPPYNRSNLNIDKRDRDYFRFESPSGSVMTLGLAYPQGLGAIAVHSLESPGGTCGVPTLVPGSDKLLPGGGHSIQYRVPGGPLRLGLSAVDVNAYNLNVKFDSDTYPIDLYEKNNDPATARRLSSRRSAGSGGVIYLSDSPRVTIDATIHAGGDDDWYIVQGATPTLVERITLGAAAFLEVYGNDSVIGLDVFELKAGNVPGKSVGSLIGVKCAPTPLSVRLDEGVYYLVKVSGAPGRYTLRNSVDGNPARIPILTRDRVYEVLHPGEPVEHRLRTPEIFVFVADFGYNAIRAAGQDVHMRLFDAPGKLVAEGAGEKLNLAATVPGQVYSLEITPKNSGANQPGALNLKWHAADARRTSKNLIVNPGAEMTVAGEKESSGGWERIEGLAAPRRIGYAEGDEGPTTSGPGSKHRGAYLFASGDTAAPSGIQQNIRLDHEWSRAIEEGRAIAHLSGFLGGERETPGVASVRLTFLDGKMQSLGEIVLAGAGPLEREGKTGLFPVESNNNVPVGTVSIRVALKLGGGMGKEVGKAYADNLELTLAEYKR